jgi:hypothetical protein
MAPPAKKSKTALYIFMGSVALLLFSSAATKENGSCRARAEVVNFWEGSSAEDADFYVQFRVTPRGCQGYCSGLLRYKIRYQAPSGRQHWESSNVEWRCDTDKEMSVEVVGTGESSLCNQEENRCKILTVVITEISCHD